MPSAPDIAAWGLGILTFLVLLTSTILSALEAHRLRAQLKDREKDLREVCRLLMLARLDRYGSKESFSDDARQVNLMAQEAPLDHLVVIALRPTPRGAVRND